MSTARLKNEYPVNNKEPVALWSDLFTEWLNSVISDNENERVILEDRILKRINIDDRSFQTMDEKIHDIKELRSGLEYVLSSFYTSNKEDNPEIISTVFKRLTVFPVEISRAFFDWAFHSNSLSFSEIEEFMDLQIEKTETDPVDSMTFHRNMEPLFTVFKEYFNRNFLVKFSSEDSHNLSLKVQLMEDIVQKMQDSKEQLLNSKYGYLGFGGLFIKITQYFSENASEVNLLPEDLSLKISAILEKSYKELKSVLKSHVFPDLSLDQQKLKRYLDMKKKESFLTNTQQLLSSKVLSTDNRPSFLVELLKDIPLALYCKGILSKESANLNDSTKILEEFEDFFDFISENTKDTPEFILFLLEDLFCRFASDATYPINTISINEFKPPARERKPDIFQYLPCELGLKLFRFLDVQPDKIIVKLAGKYGKFIKAKELNQNKVFSKKVFVDYPDFKKILETAFEKADDIEQLAVLSMDCLDLDKKTSKLVSKRLLKAENNRLDELLSFSGDKLVKRLETLFNGSLDKGDFVLASDVHLLNPFRWTACLLTCFSPFLTEKEQINLIQKQKLVYTKFKDACLSLISDENISSKIRVQKQAKKLLQNSVFLFHISLFAENLAPKARDLLFNNPEMFTTGHEDRDDLIVRMLRFRTNSSSEKISDSRSFAALSFGSKNKEVLNGSFENFCKNYTKENSQKNLKSLLKTERFSTNKFYSGSMFDTIEDIRTKESSYYPEIENFQLDHSFVDFWEETIYQEIAREQPASVCLDIFFNYLNKPEDIIKLVKTAELLKNHSFDIQNLLKDYTSIPHERYPCLPLWSLYCMGNRTLAREVAKNEAKDILLDKKGSVINSFLTFFLNDKTHFDLFRFISLVNSVTPGRKKLAFGEKETEFLMKTTADFFRKEHGEESQKGNKQRQLVSACKFIVKHGSRFFNQDEEKKSLSFKETEKELARIIGNSVLFPEFSNKNSVSLNDYSDSVDII